MRLQLLLFVIMIFSLNFTFSQQIDAEKSKVIFEVGNFKMRKVKGEFTQLSGSVDLDKQVYGFHICLKAETVNTNNAKRDEHLRTKDFFDVAQFPLICFHSESAREENGTIYVTGNLTLHGVTKQIEVPLSINGNEISGSFTVKRLDFDLGKETNTFLIGDEVKIQVMCVLK